MDTEQPKQLRGKGFVKDDPRINRSGRPKGFDDFRKVAQTIANEKLQLPDGGTIRVYDAILRSWAKSKNPQLQMRFIEYCYGKPPEKIETTELENRPVLVLHYAHERQKLMDLELQRPGDDNGEGTRRLRLPDAD
jgi:hypothetical protein